MKKTEFLHQMRESYEKLMKATDGLTDEQATQPGVTSEWSVKDTLAHLTAWEMEGAERAVKMQQGWTPPKLDMDIVHQFNAQTVGTRRKLSLPEVRRELEAARRELERIITAMPDEIDESALDFKLIRHLTIKHCAHHTEQIETWKQTMTS